MVLKLARAVAGLSMVLIANTAIGQQAQTDNIVGENVDWSVFQSESPKECWGVSAPKESVNTRDGRVVAVRRSEIQLFVVYNPESAPKGQLSFTGGYPFAPGSTVGMQIGDEQFLLTTDGEWAWPQTVADDGKIITAMKRGASAILTARSARGTQTKDTFSLLGFTAAVEDANKRCK
ncbi:hypothetical protein GG681_05135 [Epibacterium sp. SM1969]|uniref:Invasion associated locus B (IalB) protein n=1 Tax=Tritonibacter aquimaris TaxID=2663379 RepID=A0A844ANP1_9RHOB|nr:invasion associated locus B family protein [Tritonibacter aquimaris]MQY42013.1 hypothetical protein [Tritonibacter aquimaris]